MATTIQIGNVPDELHRVLTARAALAGMSLSDFLLAELREVAARPTVDELRRRILAPFERRAFGIPRRGGPARTRGRSMSTVFDTLAAARDMEAAGMERAQEEAVAGAIRAGQGELVTRTDLRTEVSRLDARMDGLGGRINGLQWIVGIDLAIGLATLAAVLAVAFRP